ncbi:hypothetical protein BDP27DRAFT_1433713 [Rhodocollybia butyracea]|uniref:Uncharacterized protein n=1 Tax=Rhodocollybia butyracea TaxID=206335 RepID=A0A9P5P3B0_9AGAR|nr:hypothetical protein BDP27DRAFT_1433713 [Rhodocollybia butyracea]
MEKSKDKRDERKKKAKLGKGEPRVSLPMIPSLKLVIPAISKPSTPPSSSPLTVPIVDSFPPTSSKKRAAPADNGRAVCQRVESPPPTPVPTVPLRSPAHSNLPTLPDSSLPPQGSTVSKIAAVPAEETVQKLIFQLMAEGHELDEKAFWVKLMNTHQQIVAKLNAEETRSHGYTEEIARLQSDLDSLAAVSAEETIQELILRLMAEGHKLDEKTFWAKLMNTHQQIVAKLNAEEAKSRGYTEEIVRLRSDEDSLATRNACLQAEVNVERARADMLATQSRHWESSMDRTKELEMKLAECEPPPSNPPSTAKLQQTIQLLQRTISKLHTELGTVNCSFTGLSSRYSELLCRNDYVMDNNRILFRDSTELQTQLAEKKREIDMLGSLLVQAMGEALSPVVEELQADRRHLQQERKIALEFASMLHQLNLTDFVWRFQQQVAELLFRIYNLIRTSSSNMATSPLFREARSVLAIAIPTVTNAATRAQVALRTVLEDFDSPFPEVWSLLERSLSRRMVHTLSRNSGFESIISTSEPVFDYDRIIRYGDVVELGAKLFPLEINLFPPVETADRVLYSRLNPTCLAQQVFPIANTSPSLPTPAVALPVLQHPPEAMEEIEYMSNEQIFGFNPTVEEGEVNEEEDDGEGDRSSGMLTTAAVDNASSAQLAVPSTFLSSLAERAQLTQERAENLLDIQGSRRGHPQTGVWMLREELVILNTSILMWTNLKPVPLELLVKSGGGFKGSDS